MDSQIFARLKTGAIVIYSEKDGVRMRDLDRDQRDACVRNLVRNDRRYLLLNLKFNDQVDPVGDKLLRIADRNGSVIVVVEDHQVNAGGCSRRPQAFGDRLREGQVFGLPPEAKANFSGTRGQPVKPILGLRDIAAMNEGLQDSIDRRLGNASSLVKGLQRQWLILRLQQFQDVQRFGQD